MIKNLQAKYSGIINPASILGLIFFLLYFDFLWQIVDVKLIYHGGGLIFNFPVFYTGREFFRLTVSVPGGLIDYISAFLAQFFNVGWLGAFIATIQVWLIYYWTGTILKKSGAKYLTILNFVIPVLLLFFYAGYEYQFGLAMNILAALGFANLYMIATSKPRQSDFAVFAAVSIACWIMAGWSCLLFAAVCFIWESLIRRRPIMVIISIVTSVAAIYAVNTFLFDIDIYDILNNIKPGFNRTQGNYTAKMIIAYLSYALIPVLVFGLGIAKKLVNEPVQAEIKKRGSAFGKLIKWLTRNAGIISPLVSIAAGILVIYFYFDYRVKTLIAVDYYAGNKMWSEVLEASNEYPENKYVVQAVNRALFHTGRLYDDMFSYQQQPDMLLLYSEVENPARWWRVSDTYIDLGHVNIAEFMLNLAMETYGERPIILKRLALINLVKGNTGATRVYLGALSRTLFDANWAKQYQDKIELDPNMSGDTEIQYLRSVMPAKNRDLSQIKENVFTDLLDKNKHNRMAFEYMAGIYLLTGKIDKFAETLGRLDKFDYGRIPRVFEEAALLYKFIDKKDALPGRQISSQSQTKFDVFRNIYFGKYRANKPAALNELAAKFGDSYFFYSVYWHSGMKQ